MPKQQHFCSFLLAGVSITDFGLEVPSPFASLVLDNSEITSMTSWELRCVVGGDASKKINVAAFEALLYSAAQAASGYKNASGIPVSFMFGWMNADGTVSSYSSYQGFTLKFKVSTTGLYMVYTISGYATLALQSSMPVLKIPALCGVVQPSAVVEALAKSVKATNYYQLDIDHCDAPTLISHGALNTSFNQYIRGTYSGQDDYDTFPGLLKLSKSYNGSRDGAGLVSSVRKLSQVVNNVSVSSVSKFLKKSLTDETPQCSSFTYWVDEPTMTRPGVIHYKSNASLANAQIEDVLEYGTVNTNILSLSGSYNGVAYNMADMKFSSVGFVLDGSGNSIAQAEEVINSWSSSLADVYQTANIVNDINAIASQFSGDFTIQIIGDVTKYTLAQPISLLVMVGGTISPITGIYNIMSVSHKIDSQFITTLKVQRLVMSSANNVAASQGIFINGSSASPQNSYSTTPNIKSVSKVDFGTLYPNFEHLSVI